MKPATNRKTRTASYWIMQTCQTGGSHVMTVSRLLRSCVLFSQSIDTEAEITRPTTRTEAATILRARRADGSVIVRTLIPSAGQLAAAS